MSDNREFDWLECGATPELADLGRRIAACIRKHGYSERDWLMRGLKHQVAELGHGQIQLIFSVGGDGAWSAALKPVQPERAA